MPRIVCVFCQKVGQQSAEHILPQWLSKVMSKHPRAYPAGGFTLIRGRSDSDQWQTIPHSSRWELTTKVCKTCNEGWMENLESAVRPWLTRLVYGLEEADMDDDVQSALAAWFALKAMCLAYTETPPLEMPRDWLDSLYEAKQAPDYWYIWITPYEGSLPFHYESRPVHGALMDSEIPIEGPANGVLATLIIGSVAVKIFGMRNGIPDHPLLSLIYQLWPPADPILHWPRRFALRDRSIRMLAGMFYLDPLAVSDRLPPFAGGLEALSVDIAPSMIRLRNY